jgi:hypothetical protein
MNPRADTFDDIGRYVMRPFPPRPSDLGLLAEIENASTVAESSDRAPR